MKAIKDLVKHRRYDDNKNVSQKYQSYGVWLANELGDTKHKSLYIKLAKEIDQFYLEQAYRFAIDYPNAKNKAKIFMWKLKDSGAFSED